MQLAVLNAAQGVGVPKHSLVCVHVQAKLPPAKRRVERVHSN